MTGASERWIRFLRQYGPIPRNDNMFDEHIRKSADRLGCSQSRSSIRFEDQLLATFDIETCYLSNVVLTGTAGDGKSHLCGRIWQALGGSAEEWATDEVYYQLHSTAGGQPTRVHLIRDLTALPDKDPKGRYTTKAALLEHLSTILFDPTAGEIFLLAANDGQLIETWQKVASGSSASRASAVFEARLMDDNDPEGVPDWPSSTSAGYKAPQSSTSRWTPSSIMKVGKTAMAKRRTTDFLAQIVQSARTTNS